MKKKLDDVEVTKLASNKKQRHPIVVSLFEHTTDGNTAPLKSVDHVSELIKISLFGQSKNLVELREIHSEGSESREINRRCDDEGGEWVW